ncbi:hypothetical protein GGH95_006699, partial [Coemansia sp. RSA 1836]
GVPEAARASKVLLPPPARAAERAGRHQQHEPCLLYVGAEGRVLHAQGRVPGEAGQARRGQPRVCDGHPAGPGVAQGVGGVGPLQRRALLQQHARHHRRGQRHQLLHASGGAVQAAARAPLPRAHAVAAQPGRRRRQRVRGVRLVQERDADVVLDRLHPAAAGRAGRAVRPPGAADPAAHRKAVPTGAVLRAAHGARGEPDRAPQAASRPGPGAARRGWRRSALAGAGAAGRASHRRAHAQAEDRAPAARPVDGDHDRPDCAPAQALPRGGHLPAGARAPCGRPAAAAPARVAGQVRPGHRRRDRVQHVPRGAGPALGRHQGALRARLWQGARDGP